MCSVTRQGQNWNEGGVCYVYECLVGYEKRSTYAIDI